MWKKFAQNKVKIQKEPMGHYNNDATTPINSEN